MAQTNISGVVNQYFEITAVDLPNNTVTLNSVAGLTIGDNVLLIQMQGATITETNDSNFGNITNHQYGTRKLYRWRHEWW